MQHEIDKHWGKLKRISKLSENQLEEARFKVFSKINFINEELIPSKTWLFAEQLTSNVDIDDTDFVALSKHLKGYLWTGDKKLYSALKRKKFRQIFNTSDLVSYRKSKS
jgi:predicted nucleic acid-binding protein